MKIWTLCLGIILAMSTGLYVRPVKADLYWETESVSSGIAHRSKGTSIQKYYFTPNASRVELSGKKIYIVNYKSMILYSLDTKAKTCSTLNLAELFLDASPGDSKKNADLMGTMLGVQVTPTNELKTIAGYKCRKCMVRIAFLTGEYWVSNDVRGYQELRTLGAKVEAIAERNPVIRQMDVAGMVDKLGGFPVYTVNHLMGGTVESTLKKVEQKSLDPALFVVPKEYTMKTMK